MCANPTINGQPGYSWNSRVEGCGGIYPVNPPALRDGDVLLFDEPGRCGGIDSHSHHFRLVRQSFGGPALLVRHGGGDEAIGLGVIRKAIDTLASLDSDARYWMLLQLYTMFRDGQNLATASCNHTWRQAAAEKRIKTRKVRRGPGVKVWILPPH